MKLSVSEVALEHVVRGAGLEPGHLMASSLNGSVLHLAVVDIVASDLWSLAVPVAVPRSPELHRGETKVDHPLLGTDELCNVSRVNSGEAKRGTYRKNGVGISAVDHQAVVGLGEELLVQRDHALLSVLVHDAAAVLPLGRGSVDGLLHVRLLQAVSNGRRPE